MGKILALLGGIPTDKLLHFFVGFVLSIIVVPLFNWSGFFIVVFVAAAKEVFFDYYLQRGKFEIADFLWTIAPSVFILLILYFNK